MKPLLKIFLTLALAPLVVQTSYGQINKMKYRNRVGDSVLIVNTQEKLERNKGPKPLTKEHAIGFRLNTDGWGAYFNYGLIKKNEGKKSEIDRFYNVLYFQLELGERYHPKEYRDFANNGVAQPYRNYFLSIFSNDMFKFGKINNFYTTKLGLGYKYLLAGKPEAKTVSIHWNTNGGLSLAILKPYLFKMGAGGEASLDPNASDLADQLVRTRFLGSGGFTNGWKNLTVMPGLYARTGLKFDYANKRQRLAGIDLNLGAEVFFNKIHQMALQEPKSLFVSASVGFELGWKR